MNIQVIDAQPSVRATLNDPSRSDQKPYPYAYEPPDVPARQGEVDTVVDIIIRDVRPLAGEISRDVQGLALLASETAVSDFYDGAEVRHIYDAETAAPLQRATGAEKVVVFDHTIQSTAKTASAAGGLREAVRHVYNHYMLKSGPRRVDGLLPSDALPRESIEVGAFVFFPPAR